MQIKNEGGCFGGDFSRGFPKINLGAENALVFLLKMTLIDIQQANIEFIIDKLSSMYQEVVCLQRQSASAQMVKQMEKSLCGQCGKKFTNKKGVKQHMIRMHTNKTVKSNIETVTLEETIDTLKTDANKVVYEKEVNVIIIPPSSVQPSPPVAKKLKNVDSINEENMTKDHNPDGINGYFLTMLLGLLGNVVERVDEKILITKATY